MRLRVEPVVHGALDYAELESLGLHPDGVLDFSVNSNAFGPSPLVRQAISDIPFDRYPDRESLALRLLEGSVDADVVNGAVVSLVRQRGIDARDLSRFFAALGDYTPLAVLGGIERHAVGVFVDSRVDAIQIVRTLHAQFVDGQP